MSQIHETYETSIICDQCLKNGEVNKMSAMTIGVDGLETAIFCVNCGEANVFSVPPQEIKLTFVIKVASRNSVG